MQRERVERFGRHGNAFGFLRLLFASLVILSHTPELADGDRSREILTRLFGTLSFGEFAVDCFFLISGFLITGSWLKTPHLRPYLRKRVARIYPAFILCSILCILVVAPLAGVSLGTIASSALRNVHLALALEPAQLPGVFEGTPYAMLNGSAWTIIYEFRCYVFVALLGLLGLLDKPLLLGALAVMFYGFFSLAPAPWFEVVQRLPHYGLFVGDAKEQLRLASVFTTGALFFVCRRRVKFRQSTLALSILGLLAGLLIPISAHAAVAIFGGYIILFAAHRATGALTVINNQNDVSYGLYLYAWPIEKLILWYFPSLPLVATGALTFIFAYALGWVSWHVVEKPILKRFAGDRSAPVAQKPTDTFATATPGAEA